MNIFGWGKLGGGGVLGPWDQKGGGWVVLTGKKSQHPPLGRRTKNVNRQNSRAGKKKMVKTLDGTA